MEERFYPRKLVPGDRVAIVSPSGGLAEVFPEPYELGLRRLRSEFELEPVEYPTTRRWHTAPAQRAADLHAAFADPDIGAVIASIGGEDQITVLPHLDRELIRANPKPFFGYSDNTNLLAYLWNTGLVGYHGGSIMVEFGRPGAMHALTAASLRAALFTSGEHELTACGETGHKQRRWDEPGALDTVPQMEPAQDWHWHHPTGVIEGVTWGGCLEILSWLLMADREVRPPETYAGCVLVAETSEEMPSATEVYRILRNMGERGLLAQFSAALIGRAKNWSFEQPLSDAERARYTADQRAAVLRAFAEYAPHATIVFDVDFGHTDPQVVLPIGGQIRIDGPARRITVQY